MEQSSIKNIKPVFQTNFKRFPVISKNQEILITEDEIVVSKKTWPINQIEGIKFDVILSMLKYRSYHFGKKFKILLKDKNKEEISIKFWSILGIGERKNFDRFDQIVEELWEKVAINLIEGFKAQLKENKVVQIGSLEIDKNGVKIHSKELFKTKIYEIPWSEVSLKEESNAIIVESKNDTKAWRRSFYSETWNGVLIKPFLGEMIDEKNVLRK